MDYWRDHPLAWAVAWGLIGFFLTCSIEGSLMSIVDNKAGFVWLWLVLPIAGAIGTAVGVVTYRAF